MGKREDYKSLKRKLKKLEKKLNKQYRDKENDYEQCSYRSRSRTKSRSPHMKRQRILSLSPSPEPQYISESQSPQISIPSPTVQPVHSPAPISTNDLNEIPIEIENLLGLEGAPCTSNAAVLHESLVKRWVAILQNGLNSQTKTDLIMKYDAPNNCQLLIPPMINEEVMAALNESAIKRDKRICEQQKILGAAISASGNVLNQLIKEQSVHNIQNLSDSCRLLCTLYHDLTDTRRKLILPGLNKDLKDTLDKSPITEYLFGDKLQDKVNACKAMKKSAQELKNTPPKVIKANSTLNFRGPQRPQVPRRSGPTSKLRPANNSTKSLAPNRPPRRSPQKLRPLRRQNFRRH